MTEEDKNRLKAIDINSCNDIEELRKAALYWQSEYNQYMKAEKKGKQLPKTGLGGAILK